MKVLFINSVCGTGSTGKICVTLAKELEQQGHEVKIACGSRHNISEDGKKYAVIIGDKKDVYFHLLKSRLFDRHCFASKRATLKFIKWAEEYNPDLLWLHNLHGYYLNIEVLFNWIKSRPQMQVKWTLHDCWAFTGHCTYFDVANCDKWKTGCGKCSQKKKYPHCSGWDNSSNNYTKKEKLFCGVSNMTLITPSQWLADLVKMSFLKDYPVDVVHNTINYEIFKPQSSTFREKHGLESKKIILGVASIWGNNKGYPDLLRLASSLNDNYTVVAVGNVMDECANLVPPSNFISIKRTDNQQQLAELYSTADVFFNPTLQDNYPTVNLEAEACGTPVVAYDSGGTKETVFRPDSVIVPKKDLDEAIRQIKRICEGK